jgi:type II secretory pathway pseudopilin PulG
MKNVGTLGIDETRGLGRLGGMPGGFTLIELVLVVLTIAVLAALAIPRYQALTARAQNGAALADLGQLCVAEAAFFGDFQEYGRSQNVFSVAAHGNGSVLLGPSSGNTFIANPDQVSPVGLSTGVHLLVHTAPDGDHFSAMVKHLGGTRIFGSDNAATGLYQRQGIQRQALEDTGIEISATEADDFTGNGWDLL